jgi:nicotinamidase-related amidase
MQNIHGLSIPLSLEDACHPASMALVVYDMQIGIVNQVEGAATIVSRIAKILETARARGFRIIFMRHMSMPCELMGAFQYRQAMAWQHTDDPATVKPWFLRGSAGFEITPELAPRPSEAILDKITFSAFEGTPLAMVLRDCGVTSFAICGIATEIGIEPTVRHGADLGLLPIVIADACGGGNAKAAERSLTSLRFMGDAIMTDQAALVHAMDRPDGSGLV